ncbi:MAG: N-acetylglucosamine-6-phosphate deacetylase [Tannerellaceae bacterium]|jgi:N-acetylglucosamine-6-phosphate deacetylase|nr:N-acetylglucosamine-6-phosphate deacetylase [Tannerellaceae bacterium]
MANTRIKLINGIIITPTGILRGASLLISGGKIAEIGIRNADVPNTQVIDVKGNYISPGFIDIHVHGGGGADFLEATPEAFIRAAGAHCIHGGTTTIYPTIAAAPREVFDRAIQACHVAMQRPSDTLAHVMGLHLEGNYLNPLMCGGQDPACLYPPHEDEYRDMLRANHCIRRWSAAPELEGALDFGRYASSRGVLVSLAHTVAAGQQVRDAFDAGYRHATHFYNAMTGVHRENGFKREGTIESIYLADEMSVELVGDGIHVPPAILRLAYKILGAERIALVTDAMLAAGSSDTGPIYGGRVIIEDGVCKLADRSAIAGSIITMNEAIRTMVVQAGVPLTDAVRMATETPATIMGINHRKGSLLRGRDADVIVFDHSYNVLSVIVEGRLIANNIPDGDPTSSDS